MGGVLPHPTSSGGPDRLLPRHPLHHPEGGGLPLPVQPGGAGGVPALHQSGYLV